MLDNTFTTAPSKEVAAENSCPSWTCMAYMGLDFPNNFLEQLWIELIVPVGKSISWMLLSTHPQYSFPLTRVRHFAYFCWFKSLVAPFHECTWFFGIHDTVKRIEQPPMIHTPTHYQHSADFYYRTSPNQSMFIIFTKCEVSIINLYLKTLKNWP